MTLPSTPYEGNEGECGRDEQIEGEGRLVCTAARQLALPYGVAGHDLGKLVAEALQHRLRREVQVVQVRVVDEPVAPVGDVQFLDALVLRVAVEEGELREIEVAVIIDFSPAARSHVDADEVVDGVVGDRSRKTLS